MKYCVDRLENDIAILEHLETKEIIEISINLLPNNIKENNIIVYDNNKYILDKGTERERKKDLLSRFNKLKKK